MRTTKELAKFMYDLHKSYESQSLHPDIIMHGFEVAMGHIQKEAFNQGVKDSMRIADIAITDHSLLIKKLLR